MENARGQSILKILFLPTVSMHVRVAFLAGCLTSYLWNRRPIPEDLASETASLRVEISKAFEALELLSESRQVCEWEIWTQRWLIRFWAVLDFVLILWILISRLQRVPQRAALLVSDTGGSSSSETEDSTGDGAGQKPEVQTVVTHTTNKGGWIRSRPARPSDFKGGKP